jgi:hypothetical protein
MTTGFRRVCLGVLLALGSNAAHPTEPTPAADATPVDRLFAVQIRTGPAWDPAKPPQEQARFQDHSAHLRRLRADGRIVLGARYSDIGLLVVTAHSVSDVEGLMRGDPSMQHGTFVFEVHPFDVFYPGSVAAPPGR